MSQTPIEKMEQLFGPVVNVAVLGNPTTGKTSVVQAVSRDGAELVHFGQEVSLFRANLTSVPTFFWVFSDLDEMSSKSIVEQADVVLIIYDTTNAQSFKAALCNWHSTVKAITKCTSIVLVATKADIKDRRVIDSDAANKFLLQNRDVQFVELSAIERSIGVSELEQILISTKLNYSGVASEESDTEARESALVMPVSNSEEPTIEEEPLASITEYIPTEPIQTLEDIAQLEIDSVDIPADDEDFHGDASILPVTRDILASRRRDDSEDSSPTEDLWYEEERLEYESRLAEEYEREQDTENAEISLTREHMDSDVNIDDDTKLESDVSTVYYRHIWLFGETSNTKIDSHHSRKASRAPERRYLANTRSSKGKSTCKKSDALSKKPAESADRKPSIVPASLLKHTKSSIVRGKERRKQSLQLASEKVRMRTNSVPTNKAPVRKSSVSVGLYGRVFKDDPVVASIHSHSANSESGRIYIRPNVQSSAPPAFDQKNLQSVGAQVRSLLRRSSLEVE